MKITNTDRQLVIDKAQRVITDTENLLFNNPNDGNRVTYVIRIHTQQKLIKEMQEGMEMETETNEYDFGKIDYQRTGLLISEFQSHAYAERYGCTVISTRESPHIDPYPVRMKINGTWYAVTLSNISDDGMNNEFF